MGAFLRQSALPGLKKYKYNGVDHSLVSKYILKPFYTRFVQLFPLWLAPNMITLSGFSFVVFNVLTVLYYNPTLDQECPAWVYWSFAIGLFLYQTFDACDGSQARRTGQSGPLGELFDHCVDACNTTLEILVFAAATNLGYTWAVVISQCATLVNFYLTTWEEYHTGVLYLSVFSGPVEGILIIVGFYIITAIKGPWFWHQNVFKLLGLHEVATSLGLPTVITDASINDTYLAFASIGLLFNIIQSSGNVLRARRAAGKSRAPAITQVLPFLGFYITVFVWIWMEPVILHEHLLPLVLTIGASFAFIVGRIIVAHVTNQKFPVFNAVLLLPSVGIAAKIFCTHLGWNEEMTGVSIVYAGLGFSVAIYACFIAEIVTEITDYLDIWCLTIKHPKVNDEKKNS